MKHLICFRFMMMLIALSSGNQLFSQTHLYFQDSPTPLMYDYSWMELTPPSELQRLGADFRKFPVNETTEAVQGMNSLSLTWKSVTNGGWFAIAAGLDWTAKDLTDTDTLHFFLYSLDGLSNQFLPLVFMEDVNNIKTTLHNFQSFSPNLQPEMWTRITIPMSLFLTAGDPVDFTKIKTIGFAQGPTDAQTHTLLIDDMRVFKGSGISPPAIAPVGVLAVGYDSHIEIIWNANPPDNLNGYKVQRSTDNGVSFQTIGMVPKTDSGYIDFVRSLGYGTNLQYRVAALNASNQASEYSEITSAATREFTDDEMLDMVQQYTFRYFYDFAHPVSGLARERNTSGDVVTSGGSGFGIMALLVGIERGFITRQQGIDRILKITDFLETADRFHGVWPHWMNGVTGDVVPFGETDNGGDLVETAFLAQGLITARQYFGGDEPLELEIRNRITQLWETIEWDWYTKNNSTVLYWHWSPTYGWQINMQIRGWNEAAIIYILAIASPTHGVNASLWRTGWAGQSYYLNGGSFYGYKLDVGWDYGGPLFFAHYSFQGFDPRNIKDQYTNYFNLNRNHTLIQRAYAIDNPKNHPGYGENAWGFTASDDPSGYLVHEPTGSRDNGTITPTAALSSMPYTPEESLGALKHFYRELGDKTWGRMGFYDAYNLKVNWYADSYLAIDQGPIINMIENHRSSLLWDNFMANPEIAPALQNIGFIPDPNSINDHSSYSEMSVWPNPTSGNVKLSFSLKENISVYISVTDLTGKSLSQYDFSNNAAGLNTVDLDVSSLKPGMYLVKLASDKQVLGTIKLVLAN